MKEKSAVLLVIAISTGLLIFGCGTLSISYYEADIFYNQSSVAHYLSRISCAIFGQNDYALRAPFIILHAFSSYLLYLVSCPILKRTTDRVMALSIYVMMPGVISAALLVNSAGIVIFGILLSIYLYQNEKRIALYAVLLGALFLDAGFTILYFLLFFYAVFRKDTALMIAALAFFTIAMYFYGADISQMSSGKPRGYFVDTFGIYAAIFSPFLFLYFIYVEYRILVKGGKNLIWWLSFGAFIASLLLSFRQRIPIEIFGLYLVIAAPLMVSTFLNSYRVRLPRHRKFHKLIASIVVISLVFNCVLVLFNHTLYPLFDSPKDHFAYRYHIVKELSIELKKRGIDEVITQDERLALRLRFYGIKSGGIVALVKSSDGDIAIKYAGRKVESFELKNENL